MFIRILRSLRDLSFSPTRTSAACGGTKTRSVDFTLIMIPASHLFTLVLRLPELSFDAPSRLAAALSLSYAIRKTSLVLSDRRLRQAITGCYIASMVTLSSLLSHFRQLSETDLSKYTSQITMTKRDASRKVLVANWLVCYGKQKANGMVGNVIQHPILQWTWRAQCCH